MQFRARTWKVGDNINTDLILPNRAFYLTPQEQTNFVFSANRPGWSDLVVKGDILIGGNNFGMGSSRPAARSLRNLGLACLVAESINGLFFRNCVNFAFPAMECPGVAAAFEEGDEAEVSFEDASIVNKRTGVRLTGRSMPAELRAVVAAGGLFPLLEQQGYIASRASA